MNIIAKNILDVSVKFKHDNCIPILPGFLALWNCNYCLFNGSFRCPSQNNVHLLYMKNTKAVNHCPLNWLTTLTFIFYYWYFAWCCICISTFNINYTFSIFGYCVIYFRLHTFVFVLTLYICIHTIFNLQTCIRCWIFLFNQFENW